MPRKGDTNIYADTEYRACISTWIGALLCILMGAAIAAWFGMHRWQNLLIYNILLSAPLDQGTAFGINGFDIAPDVYIEECTNSTGTQREMKIENRASFAMAYMCPLTKNSCDIYLCGGNGTCSLNLTTGALCSTDSECFTEMGTGYRCDNTTCTCVRNMGCVTIEDCPVLDNPCATMICSDDGICVEELNMGATCSSSDQCFTLNNNSLYHCDLGSCDCIFQNPIMPNESCETVANCPVPSNQCLSYACVNETCQETLADGAGCANSNFCHDSFGNEYSCSLATCQCEIFPMVTGISCTTELGCPTLLNLCSSYVCVEGVCEEELNDGANCSADSQCETQSGGSLFCNLATCSCSPRSPILPSVNFYRQIAQLELDAITFSGETFSVGPQFWSHGVAPFDVVTLPDPTNGTHMYQSFFRVEVEQTTPIEISLMGGGVEVPGCKAYAVLQDGFADIATVYNTCIFPGYPYGVAGLTVSNEGVGQIDTTFAYWVITKLS